MYNSYAPHCPYILLAGFPPSSPVIRGSYPLDWFISPTWLEIFQPHLIEAHGNYQQWLGAAHFFQLDCHGLDKFQLIPESNELIQFDVDGDLPRSFKEAGTKFSIPKLVIALKNDEGQLHGIACYLMHRIVDH